MKSFPLVRTRWSNEHVMSSLFVALVLYLVPVWIKSPVAVLSFLALFMVGLLIDLIGNVVRYKRPVCGVSAAVTVGIFTVLTEGVPFWGQLVGVVLALLVGKHVWGGTGKNPINPAIAGVLVTSLFFPLELTVFSPSWLLVPAVVLSLPFVRFRPFAAVGFMFGMVTWLTLNPGLSLENLLAYGVLFWGSIVLTDPVTVNRHPVIGGVGGFLAGFLPLFFGGKVMGLALGVIVFNIISYITEAVRSTTRVTSRSVKVKGFSPFVVEDVVVRDLTGKDRVPNGEVSDLTRDSILQRIRENQVFGMGGGAFSTYDKVLTFDKANCVQRHLLINGVECDPGLIHDKWLLREHASEILKGIEVLRKCINFDSVVLAVKDAQGLKFPPGVQVHQVPDRYPIGAEKLLIENVFGRQLARDMIPAEEGILVLNVQTIYSIYEAVCLNQKADTRFLTVANLRKHDRQVARVKLGMKLRDVAESVYSEAGQIFYGGGLMQSKVVNEDELVDRNVNFIAFADYPRYKESPACSKCGLCVKNCPANLEVYQIAEHVDRKEFEKLRALHIERCIQCGSCSFVCLAGRNLSARLRNAQGCMQKGLVS